MILVYSSLYCGRQGINPTDGKLACVPQHNIRPLLVRRCRSPVRRLSAQFELDVYGSSQPPTGLNLKPKIRCVNMCKPMQGGTLSVSRIELNHVSSNTATKRTISCWISLVYLWREKNDCILHTDGSCLLVDHLDLVEVATSRAVEKQKTLWITVNMCSDR